MSVERPDPGLERTALSQDDRSPAPPNHLALAQTQAPLPPALDKTLTPLPPDLERRTPLPPVGETEARIAKMFAQAANTGALLLLDEADSFLSARQGAKQHWDVTAVNKLLVQMEQFDGLFISKSPANSSSPGPLAR